MFRCSAMLRLALLCGALVPAVHAASDDYEFVIGIQGVAACPDGTGVIRSQSMCTQAVQYLSAAGTKVGVDGMNPLYCYDDCAGTGICISGASGKTWLRADDEISHRVG